MFLNAFQGVKREMIRSTMEDLMKACIDPTVKLPMFYIVDLRRVLSVSVEHCDISIILQEVQALRTQVREPVDLHGEVQNIKANYVSSRNLMC